MKKRLGLSGSALKILACAFMLVDHIGAKLLPQYRILRVIGRLAFPVFAFCIAEGCRHTRHKGKHFALIFGFGAVWEALLIYYYGKWDGNIFLTFSLSIVLIYLWQAIKRQWCIRGVWVGMALSVLYGILVVALHMFVKKVHVEYGIFGVLTAVSVSVFDYKSGEAPRWMKYVDVLPVRLLLMSIALFFLALPTLGRTVQIYALLAIPVLALYNGTVGNRHLKYAFYAFYPLHLMVLEALRQWR